MKKRILHFFGSFHQGGSERQAVNLVKLLKDEGSFDVFAATLNDEGVLRPEIETAGLTEVPAFPLTSFYNVNFIRQIRKCVRHLRDHKIDIVHTHDFYTNIFGMTAARIAGVAIRIASKRETGGMRSLPQQLVEKLAFGQANAIVVNSSAVRDYLINSGINGENIHTIYNGIDVKRFSKGGDSRAAICEKFGISSDDSIRFITTIANLRHDVKNFPMLLHAAKRITQDRPNVHFIIAGEGELETQLKETAKTLGVAENVHFIGRCDDVPALLGISYACVLTSTAEGFSNSILEYMAAGKPVVVTRVGGAAEAVIDGETGFLVASDDDAAMAERIIELLEGETKASAFGAKARLVVEEKFSQETQLRSTFKSYDSLLNRSR